MSFRKTILKFLTIMGIAVGIFQPFSNALGYGLFDDCVYGWDFGNDKRKVVVVRPLGEVCYQRCKGECKNFGLTLSGDNVGQNSEEAIQNVEMHQDLNRDLIEKCYLSCQKGAIFESKYRIPIKDKNSEREFEWSKEIAKTSAFCGGAYIANADYAYFGSGLAIDPKDTSCSDPGRLSTCQNAVLIKLLNPPDGGGNMIHLCGFGTARIDPVTTSLVDLEWLQNGWGNTRVNGIVPQPGDPPSPAWNARNPYWLDSGLDVKDGDFLSITFSGNYIFKNTLLSNSLQVWKPGFVGTFLINSDYYKISGDDLKLIDITGDHDSEDVDYGSDIEKIVEDNKKVTWNGLGTVYGSNPKVGGWQRVWKGNRPMPNALSSSIDSKTIQIRDKVVNKDDRSKEFYRNQLFMGILDGFSKKYGRLAFRHHDNPSESYISRMTGSNWNNNLGGMSVIASWKGCIFSKGQRLQYTVVPSPAENQFYRPEDVQDVRWVDLEPDQIDGSKVFRVVGNTKGQIFFRIKKLPNTYTEDEDLSPSNIITGNPSQSTINNVVNNASNKYARYSTGGEYMLSIEKTATKSVVGGIIGSFVNSVNDYLFVEDADDIRKGIAPKMFKKFISDTSFVQAIRALLILYIAWTGLSYMIGLSNINQKEGIIRLLKISLVLIVISDKGFDFFNYYLFDAIKLGAMNIIMQISAPMYEVSTGGDTITADSVRDQIVIIFSVFDKPFQTLFSDDVWKKICALVFSGLIGFFVALIIVIACATYVFCIAKCTLIFLNFLVFLGFFMMIGPIFIPFILFKFTRPMFDNWLKLLISFGLQPIFVFVSVTFLNTLLMAALYTTLGFTACSICFLRFHIPVLVDVCLIPGWVALISSYNPYTNAVAAPIANIPAAILLLIVSQAFYTFCGFCTVLARSIATGNYFGVDFNEVSKSSNPITTAEFAIGGIQRVTGTDQTSRGYYNKVGSHLKRARKPGAGGGSEAPKAPRR